MQGNVSILCTGDIHLGRHPSRIPSELDGIEFSPRSIWQSTVAEAIDRDVDAVIVTGDVVDRENRYFEAFGAFENGVAELADADIRLITVSGNHDHDVLPGMISDLNRDGLHLLGEGGEWERWSLTADDEPVLHFDGWSFPNASVLDSPIDDYERDADSGVPVLGLLHADVDAAGSRYAPVTTSELRSAPVDGWLLGHIHSPTVLLEANPFGLYPGSPQPLDPGERDAHGPWQLAVDETGTIEAQHIPLASIRYDELSVDVGDIEKYTTAATRVSDEVTEYVREEVDAATLELFLPRITLTGRTPAHADLVENRDTVEADLSPTVDSLPVRVEDLRIETQPAVDLEEYVGADNPVGWIAELLQAISDGPAEDEYDELVADAVSALREAYQAGAYDELRRHDRSEEPDEEQAVSSLEEQAKLLLYELDEQKEATS